MISHQKTNNNKVHGTGASLDINQRDYVITIKVGANLDLSLHDLFMKAIRYGQGSIRNRIVVDLEKTQRIFDSGLVLLMMLDLRSWRKSCKVRIINCSVDLEQRIHQCLAPGLFNLSQDNQQSYDRIAAQHS